MPTSPPNVVLIMADQHRADYLGCAGASFVRTPNIDALARRGIRFTNCFTNAPVCVAARIGLATGLQPFRLGALDNDAYLPRRAPTYYRHMRDHGLRVGLVGKVDLAKPSRYNGRHGDRPVVFSFGFTHPEECEGKMHAGVSPTPLGPYGFHLQERGLYDAFHADYLHRQERGWTVDACADSVLPTDAFEDCYIGRRSTEWIDQIPDDFPFHLMVSFVGPHDPYDPPCEYADRYRNAKMPPPIPASPDKPASVQRRFVSSDLEKIAITRRQYCASIEAIDDQIGQIIASLQRRNMLDNTHIVFTSDHGELLGDHGLYAKSAAYESSIRIPLIAAGPGIAPGRTSDAIVELIDVNPTLCDLAGLPPQSDLDARSFLPILRGQSTTHREDALSSLRHFRCLRTERYKFIQNIGEEPELYDLHEDPNEMHNLVSTRLDILRPLQKRLKQRVLEGEYLR